MICMVYFQIISLEGVLRQACQIFTISRMHRPGALAEREDANYALLPGSDAEKAHCHSLAHTLIPDQIPKPVARARARGATVEGHDGSKVENPRLCRARTISMSDEGNGISACGNAWKMLSRGNVEPTSAAAGHTQELLVMRGEEAGDDDPGKDVVLQGCSLEVGLKQRMLELMAQEEAAQVRAGQNEAGWASSVTFPDD